MSFTRQLAGVVAVAVLSSAQADIIHVDVNCPGPGDGSELNPYCSIQTAIDHAVAADEIVVAPGTYFETINFLGKAITLRSSGGPEVTTIDAQEVDTVVTCDGGEGPDTVLDGFTVTNGAALFGGGMYNSGSSPTVRNCNFVGNSAGFNGGGMLNSDGGPTVIECSFVGNTADHRGGGMHNAGSSSTVIDSTFVGNYADDRGGGMQNTGGSPLVIDCTFDQNIAGLRGGGIGNLGGFPIVTGCTFSANDTRFGGGIHNHGGSPTVIECTFMGNTVDLVGGGIDNSDSSPLISQCVFVGNYSTLCGGAIRNLDNSSPLIVACVFVDNAGSCGGGIFTVSSNAPPARPVVASCVFRGNTAHNGVGGGMVNSHGSGVTILQCIFAENNSTAYSGGGIYNTLGVSSTVSACTFCGNTSAVTGGGIENGGTLAVANCILWGNIPDQANDDVEGVTTVRYSDVEGGWPGIGNIDADPLFVNAGNGNLRLLPASPCIDAGNNWGVSGDFVDLDSDGDTLELTPLDLDGNPRFAGDGNDSDPGCGEPVVVDMGAYEFRGTPFNVVFGDLNGNGTVGVVDLMILNECMGSDDPDCCIADLNMDGVIGLIDRLLMGAAMVEIVPAATVRQAEPIRSTLRGGDQ